MIKQTVFQAGKLNGVVVAFPIIGDTLPMHAHGPDDVHVTIITNGCFRVHGDGIDQQAFAGDIFDWEVGQMHEIVATSINGRVINIIKGA